jgi:ADP-heptose:LPS heptosyltransferase
MKPGNIATLSGSDYAVATTLGAVARVIFAGRRTPGLGAGAVEQARSALLIRPEGLGDIILTLPAIDCLRRANPQLRITMVVRPMFADFVRDIGVVEETIALDYPKRSTLAWNDLAPVLRQVRGMRGRYDLAFDFRGDPRNAMLGAWSAKAVVGEATVGTNFLLSQSTERRFDCARALQHRELAAKVVGQGPGPDEPMRFSIRLRSEVAERALAMTGGRRGYILIHAGASLPSKEWGTARWKSLVRALADAGHRLVFTGAPGEEAELAQAIAATLGPDAGRWVNLAGKTTASELAGAVQGAGAVISPDTGVAHLAHAMRVPSVTIFGAESEVIYGYPGSPMNLAMYAEIECRPCCQRRCPRTDFPMECMERVTVDAVMRAVRQAMGALPVLNGRDETVSSATPA